jgi:hypothetical protein
MLMMTLSLRVPKMVTHSKTKSQKVKKSATTKAARMGKSGAKEDYRKDDWDCEYVICFWRRGESLLLSRDGPSSASFFLVRFIFFFFFFFFTFNVCRSGAGVAGVFCSRSCTVVNKASRLAPSLGPLSM